MEHSVVGVGAYGCWDHHNLEELILSNQIGDGFRSVLEAEHNSSINVMGQVDRNGSMNVQATERNGGEVRSAVERNGGETRHTVERNAGETRATIDRLGIVLGRDLGDIRREAVEHKSQIVLEACKNTHTLTLQAAENAAAIAKQVAECCCEVKEAIRTEACDTRALLQAQENQRLRDELAAANNANNLLQLGVGRGLGKA